MDAVLCSAPGKAILIGEHAAVYGRPALVAAVGLRSVARLVEAGRGVSLDLPAVNRRVTTSWAAIRSETASARRAAEEPGPARPSEWLAAVALGEAVAAFGPDDPPPAALTLTSDIPPGSGFGSSAALAVAVVAAWARFAGIAAPPERIAAAALEVERRQHGTPSGVDTQAAQRGGVLWAVRSREGRLEVTALGTEGTLLADFALFDTGVPADSTGVVVATVRRRLESDAALEATLDEIAGAARDLREQIEAPNGDAFRVVASIRRSARALERLGVVPAEVADVVRSIESGGGSAKISGAGAVRGDRAGLVLVYHPDRGWVRRWTPPRGWRRIEAPLGVDGLRVEEVGA